MTTEAHKTFLVIKNEGVFYATHAKPLLATLAAKVVAGTYDATEAAANFTRLICQWVDNSTEWKKVYGGVKPSMADCKLAADELLTSYEDELQDMAEDLKQIKPRFSNYKTEAIAALALEIRDAGFRVFIAESGTYGFYTDADGNHVVSFQYDIGGFKFSGNYKSKTCGTGWVMDADTFKSMFAQLPPRWATRGEEVKQSTLAQHLSNYQQSSRFVELKKDAK